MTKILLYMYMKARVSATARLGLEITIFYFLREFSITERLGNHVSLNFTRLHCFLYPENHIQAKKAIEKHVGS